MTVTGHNRTARPGFLGLLAIVIGMSFCTALFQLPGLVYGDSGQSVLIPLVIAALLAVPGLLSASELSSAMPEDHLLSHFFVRAAGPAAGVVGGVTVWFWYVITGTLALHGLVAALDLLIPEVSQYPVGSVLAGLSGVCVYLGISRASKLQNLYLVLMSGLIVGVIVTGWVFLDGGKPDWNLDIGTAGIWGASGLALSGYAGFITAGAHSEDRRPIGLILLYFVSSTVVVLVSMFVTRVVPGGQIVDGLTAVVRGFDLTSTSTVPSPLIVIGTTGLLIGATLCTVFAHREWQSVWLLMSDSSSDRPGETGRARGLSILVTAVATALVIQFVGALPVARLAGAFLLLVILFLCLSVIILRESHVDWFVPQTPTRFYPLIPIIGLLSGLFILFRFQSGVILLACAVPVIAASVYILAGVGRAEPGGAIYFWFARLGERRYAGLDRELRGILKEKGLREEDPFDEIVARSSVMESGSTETFESIVERASTLFAPVISLPAKRISDLFLEGTRMGATPVTHGVALPHFRIEGLVQPEMVLVRSKKGLHVVSNDPIIGHEEAQDVNAVFFLVSAEENPGQHLRLLAQVAGRVDDEGFIDDWLDAGDEADLKEVLLRDDRFMSLYIRSDTAAASLIETALKDIQIPEGCLIAMVRREGSILVPRGNTVLYEGDRLTIIGDARGLKEFRSRYDSRATGSRSGTKK